jgi:hypothetical protein
LPVLATWVFFAGLLCGPAEDPGDVAPQPGGASSVPSVSSPFAENQGGAKRHNAEGEPGRQPPPFEGKESLHFTSADQTPEPEQAPPYQVGYEQGLVLRPRDFSETPFQARLRGFIQLRHTALVRDETSWTDSAGVVRPITPRNDFEIERGRLTLDGAFLDPDLGYYATIDGDTDDVGGALEFFDYWISYRFSPRCTVHAGRGKVPGSREWVTSFKDLHLSERSIDTTFFRPDRTVGIWATGEVVESVHYHALVGNGYATTILTPAQIDDRFAVAGSVWWEPWGAFGFAYSDLDHHDEPVMRIGTSYTFSSQHDLTATTLPELWVFSLTDGTTLTDAGALAPGARVTDFDAHLWSVDAALKWRGVGVNGEYFLRSLQSFSGTGPVPDVTINDHGFHVNAGVFLIPQRLELVGGGAWVGGPFGDTHGYTANVNWFVKGTIQWRISFAVSVLDHTPTTNLGANYRAGDSGVLFLTQCQAGF